MTRYDSAGKLHGPGADRSAARDRLRELLESMNDAPGHVNANNALIPFAKFDTLHFARFVILDDKTVEDVGSTVPTRDLSALSRVSRRYRWRSPRAFSASWRSGRATGLRTIFSCCAGFTAQRPISLGG